MGDALLDAASVLGLPGGSAPLRMPELGPGARPRLHLAPRESAGVHFEWRASGAGGASPRGSLVVSGYVSAAAEKRAKAAGARPGAALLSVNGVILGDRDKGFIMQRMSSTLGVARQLGFGDFPEAEAAPALRHSTSQQTLKTAPASPLAPKPASASSAPRASNAGSAARGAAARRAAPPPPRRRRGDADPGLGAALPRARRALRARRRRGAAAWLAVAEAWRRRARSCGAGSAPSATPSASGAAPPRARAARVRRLREAMRRCLGLLSSRASSLRRWRDETRRALALQRAARRWRAFLLDRAAFRAMVRRAALAAEVLRRSARQRRRRRAWDAWRTAYAEELRSDRIKAALAARAAAELLARLAAQKAMEVSEDEGIDAPSSEDTESVEEEPAWTPPDRTCVRCGHRGPGSGFALSDDVCLACFGEEAARLARLREARRRGPS
ncbi:hypothetical protein JL720_2271 [Aureococcus anophagefferens]|nr:hypothetical protein JL720_2271 [Aureococcus anophagefferens]